MRTRTPCVLMLLSLAFFPVAALAEEGAYQKALVQAEALAERNDHKNAIKAYKKAQKLADAPTFACCYGLARLFNKTGSFKNSVESARQAVQLAQSPQEEAAAYHQLGLARYRGGSSPAQLEEAVEAFSKVLELTRGEALAARLNLGMALLKLERDEEGVAVLQQFVAVAPEGPAVEQALSYIDNPRRVRVNLLPEFEVTTLDGEVLTPEDLLGKVVLIDFWGTWCAPCVASIPHLQQLTRRHEKNPFLVLSVSNDRDEDALRDFVVEKNMGWHQVWDEDLELTGRLFEIDSYPTFILVDHEGVMIYRDSGWSERMGRDLDARIARAVRGAKKAEK